MGAVIRINGIRVTASTRFAARSAVRFGGGWRDDRRDERKRDCGGEPDPTDACDELRAREAGDWANVDGFVFEEAIVTKACEGDGDESLVDHTVELNGRFVGHFRN